MRQHIFFSVNSISFLFVALCVLLFIRPICSIVTIVLELDSHSHSNFYLSFVSYNHSREGTIHISVGGRNVRRLLLESEHAATSWLGGSWSGGVDSGLFEVSLAMRTDFDSRHCFLHMSST